MGGTRGLRALLLGHIQGCLRSPYCLEERCNTRLHIATRRICNSCESVWWRRSSSLSLCLVYRHLPVGTYVCAAGSPVSPRERAGATTGPRGRTRRRPQTQTGCASGTSSPARSRAGCEARISGGGKRESRAMGVARLCADLMMTRMCVCVFVCTGGPVCTCTHICTRV